MSEAIGIPPSFSLIGKGKVVLLLKEDLEETLLQMGICDIESLLKRSRKTARTLAGRMPHPLLPLPDGRWMVVRRYIHGGLLKGLTGDRFFFGSRSFRELAVTEKIRSCGMATVEPVGAVRLSAFPFFYRAYFLSIEVPGAMNLVQYLSEKTTHQPQHLPSKRNTLSGVGLLLRRFHDAGFVHRDLQLKNILVAHGEPLLIDFDRCFQKSTLSIRDRMKNLLRLNRSAEKWKQAGLPVTRTDRWRLFCAYAKRDKAILRAGRRIWRTYPVRLFFYRLGWAWNR
jgi:hypothetical protein